VIILIGYSLHLKVLLGGVNLGKFIIRGSFIVIYHVLIFGKDIALSVK